MYARCLPPRLGVSPAARRLLLAAMRGRHALVVPAAAFSSSLSSTSSRSSSSAAALHRLDVPSAVLYSTPSAPGTRQPWLPHRCGAHRFEDSTQPGAMAATDSPRSVGVGPLDDTHAHLVAFGWPLLRPRQKQNPASASNSASSSSSSSSSGITFDTWNDLNHSEAPGPSSLYPSPPHDQHQSQTGHDPANKARYQLNEAVRQLRAELPRTFLTHAPLNDSLYTDDIELIDRLHGFFGFRIRGRTSYRVALSCFRQMCHLHFVDPQFNMLSLRPLPEQRAVHCRWQVTGSPRITLVPTTFDAVSTFHLDSEGKIYRHVVDNVTPTSRRSRFVNQDGCCIGYA